MSRNVQWSTLLHDQLPAQWWLCFVLLKPFVMGSRLRLYHIDEKDNKLCWKFYYFGKPPIGHGLSAWWEHQPPLTPCTCPLQYCRVSRRWHKTPPVLRLSGHSRHSLPHSFPLFLLSALLSLPSLCSSLSSFIHWFVKYLWKSKAELYARST